MNQTLQLFWNWCTCLCQQSQHNHIIGNQPFHISVWNIVTPIWLALTFVRFQFRSILTWKAWTGKARWLFDGVISVWNLTFSYPCVIQVAAPCHSNLPCQSQISSNSCLIIYFSETWLKFEQWGAGGFLMTFHLISWWVLLLISSCLRLQSLPQSRYNERWFSKNSSNPKYWHRKNTS